jgi:2-dehydro-3-deoxyphosphogluconate aldolase/(4S)-4-hydroxy-2-oxoglutarate aldolase
MSPTQVDESADAGAAFVVSPGLDDDVVQRTYERGLLPLPGTATATEVQRARKLDAVKFFRAELFGGST